MDKLPALTGSEKQIWCYNTSTVKEGEQTPRNI